MGFNKIRQGVEEIFTLIIESPEIIYGKKERERWTVMKRDFPKLVDMLSVKYGFTLRKKEDNKDLDWAV
jgi:hypothetical protein